MKRNAAAIILFLLAACIGQERLNAQSRTSASSDLRVNAEDLLTKPVGENWPSYNGDYTGRRFSSLNEINSANVGQLRTAWVFHPGNSQRLEATPVVMHGVMYVTSANDVFALDARTGRALWHYSRPISSGLLDDSAGHINRGVAVRENFV
jgi:alcohol dehydrogenase (cytochrome c)